MISRKWVSLVEVSINIENFVVENPKAVTILVGAFLLLIGVAIPSVVVGLTGFIVLLLAFLASLPEDVREWIMNGLGIAAKDVWES